MATNESEVSESAIMSGLEAYSAPNVGQDKIIESGRVSRGAD